MKRNVMLSIRGRQHYPEQEPETIELVTEGTMEFRDGGWDICYEETELTGLQGVCTQFRVEPDKIILNRSGRLNSQMIFEKEVRHDSLYQMDFGALMISVCAKWLSADLDYTGGIVDLIYTIEIEQTTAGEVDYHLVIMPKK